MVMRKRSGIKVNQRLMNEPNYTSLWTKLTDCFHGKLYKVIISNIRCGDVYTLWERLGESVAAVDEDQAVADLADWTSSKFAAGRLVVKI